MTACRGQVQENENMRQQASIPAAAAPALARMQRRHSLQRRAPPPSGPALLLQAVGGCLAAWRTPPFLFAHLQVLYLPLLAQQLFVVQLEHLDADTKEARGALGGASLHAKAA